MKSKISEAICRDMEQWFESFHQAPETAMQEYDTSRIIAERLRDFGYEVTEGIGKTRHRSYHAAWRGDALPWDPRGV